MPTITATADNAYQSSVATRARLGLTSRQAWTLDHIVRCPACGAWTTLTDAELSEGAATAADPICRHFQAAG